MSSGLSAVTLGLSAAISWGTGDFSVGIATKKSNVYIVIIISQIIGLILLLNFAFIFSEPFPSSIEDIIWGILAGTFGAIGLVSLYRGLAIKDMGIMAPVSSVVSVIIPMIVSIFIEGVPKIIQLIGFITAIISVWLVSTTGDQKNFQLNSLELPIIAGCGFGFFLVFINQVTEGVILWPLIAARIASISILLIIVTLFKKIKITNPYQLPLAIIALAGICDAGGNILFTIATQIGRLDVAAVLTSLSPVVTVLLALLILKEKINYRRGIGIIIALVSFFLYPHKIHLIKYYKVISF